MSIKAIFFRWILLLTIVPTLSCSKSKNDGSGFPLVDVSLPAIGRTPDFRGGAGGHDIILITIDTLRASHLHCYGYPLSTSPFLDSLAAEGFLFQRMYTPVPRTLPSHVSLFTSLYPYQHGLSNNALYIEPLADMTLLPTELKKHGYETAAFVSAFVLNSRFGLDRYFDYYDDTGTAVGSQGRSEGQEGWKRAASTTIDSALEWLRKGREDRTKPLFIWIHLFDCHPKFVYDPVFYHDFLGNPWYEGFNKPGIEISEGYVARYDAAVRTVDREVKRFHEGFNSIVSAEPLTIVTADHGESLGEHNLKGHINILFEQTLRVPLIIHAPWLFGEYSGSVKALCSTLDIFPTIMGLLDIDVDGLKGRNLFPIQQIGPERILADVTSQNIILRKKAVIEGRWKLLIPDILIDKVQKKINLEDPKIKRFLETYASNRDQSLEMLLKNKINLDQETRVQLYDLLRDPYESMNLADIHPEVVDSLLPAVREMQKEARYLKAEILTEDAREALEALGYLQ